MESQPEKNETEPSTSSDTYTAPPSAVDLGDLKKGLPELSLCERCDVIECLQYLAAVCICLLPAIFALYFYWPRTTTEPVYCSKCARFHNQWCLHVSSDECVCINDAEPIILNKTQQHCIRTEFCDLEMKSFINSVRSSCARTANLDRFLQLVFRDTRLVDISNSHSYVAAMLVRVAYEEKYPCEDKSVETCISILKQERIIKDLHTPLEQAQWLKVGDENDTRWNLFNCVIDEAADPGVCEEFHDLENEERLFGNNSMGVQETLHRFYLVALLYSYGEYDPLTSFDTWKEPIVEYSIRTGAVDELWLLATVAYMYSPKAERMLQAYKLELTVSSKQWKDAVTSECEENYHLLAMDLLLYPIRGDFSHSFIRPCAVHCGAGCSVLMMKSKVAGSMEIPLPWWFLGECEEETSESCIKVMDFLTSDVRDSFEDCFDEDRSVLPRFKCLFETVHDSCVMENECDPETGIELSLRIWTSYSKYWNCLESTSEVNIAAECKPIKVAST